MKFKETRTLIASDYRRIADFWEKKLGVLLAIKLTLSPSVFSILLYRLAHYFHTKNLKFIAWILWAFNMFVTGADIHPSSLIGKALLIGHPLGTVISAKLGDNVTLYGQAAIGGGRGTKDVGAGPGLPVVEDNAHIGFRATILGGVLIGTGATVAPCSFVIKNVPPHCTAFGNPAKIIKRPKNI